MLIDRHDWADRPSAEEVSYPSPVVGSAINDKVPTSGDVHLYADPASFSTERPILYADCEGLEGGETVPYAAQSRNRSGSGSRKNKKLQKVMNGRPRIIAWANDEKTRKREYAVTELYPRLLYTFSDVVVFVLRNAKYVERSRRKASQY